MKTFHYFLLLLFVACQPMADQHAGEEIQFVQLSLAQAERLASLPLKCIQQEYPNKPGQIMESERDLLSPSQMYPAFYGCFDWHSAVHGHWMLVHLIKRYPEMKNADLIKQRLQEQINSETMAAELAYFQQSVNKSFERTYGWTWLLKLSEEIRTWKDPIAQQMAVDLQPLVDLLIERYLEFLPKLVYPIRVGEHTNTAFGLSFAYDYALTFKHEALKSAIEQKALAFYMNDLNCPLTWEPSGYDFLSPCLEEANLMRKILSASQFRNWMDHFLPEMRKTNFYWAPAEVSDRTDGKLVHLDGLNFSRAWCMAGIAKTLPEYQHLRGLANQHIQHSLPGMVDGSYEGEHWLASFAVWALAENEQ